MAQNRANFNTKKKLVLRAPAPNPDQEPFGGKFLAFGGPSAKY